MAAAISDYIPITSTTKINRTANKASVCLVNKINRHTVNAISNGRIQYPRTQTLWKKDLKR